MTDKHMKRYCTQLNIDAIAQLLDFSRSKRTLPSLSILPVFLIARWLQEGNLEISAQSSKRASSSKLRKMRIVFREANLEVTQCCHQHNRLVKAVTSQNVLGEVNEILSINESVARAHGPRSRGTREAAVPIFPNYTVYRIGNYIFKESIKMSSQITYNCRGGKTPVNH